MAQFVDRIPLFLLVLSTLLPIIYALDNSTSVSIISSSAIPASTASHSSATNHTAHLNSTTTTHHVPMTSTHVPVSPTKTSTPSRTSSEHISPTPTHTVIPTSTFNTNFTTARPTTVKPTAHPTDCHTCKEQLKSERHYKWAAVAFDVIFAIALVIMTIMYLRQRKMYREMEGDGSLSRLI